MVGTIRFIALSLIGLSYFIFKVRRKKERKGQQPDHDRDDSAEQAELRIGKHPLGLQEREHGIQNLPRHIVRDQ